MQQARLKGFGKYAGYVVLMLLLTVYFMILTFPYDSLKARLWPSLERTLPCKISVNEIEATPLLWLRLSDVQIDEKGKPLSSPLLEMDQVRMRPSLLSLFIGRLNMRIKGDLYSGKIKGKVGRRKELVDLVLVWDDATPAQHPFFSKLQGAQLEGGTSGEARLKINPRQWITTSGTISFRIDDGSIKDLEVYGFTVPELRDITVAGELAVNNKKATLETMSLNSEQFSASLDGTVTLSPLFDNSRLDLKGKLKQLGELETQYQPMISGFLRNQDQEGFFTFKLKGTLGKPKFSL